MRALFFCVLILSAGCAERNYVKRGDAVGVPASSVATTPSAPSTQPGVPREALRGESLSATSDELLEEKRREPRPALDPNAAPETTNYD